MLTLTWVFLVALIIISAFIVLFHIQYRRHLNEKEMRVKELVRSLSHLEKKLHHEDRRVALRVKLTKDEMCHFELSKFGDHTLNHLLNKRGKGLIYDVSHTGLSMICKIDLPVRKQIYLNLKFEVLDEEFNLKGVMRSKNEDMNGQIQYGIKFLEMNFLDKKRLAKAIQGYGIYNKKRA